MIGDCRSAALVSRFGSVDWLCWPRFDSPAIFAAILDRDIGGHWSIAPAGDFEAKRSYVPNTNILETSFVTGHGRAVLKDLMPVASEEDKRTCLYPDHDLIRQFSCTEGEMLVEVDFYPRPNYGRDTARIQSVGKLGVRIDVGRGAYWLRSDLPWSIEPDRVRAAVKISRGDVLQFSLSYSEESPAVLPALGDQITARIAQTENWWKAWSSRCKYEGPYAEAVVRSALALKLLAYAPSGAITAAVSTSLPELPGGSLNWDYRYCWLRDASLTVRALLGLGYIEEAESFLTWLLHSTRMTQPRLLVLYNLYGEVSPREKTLDWLSGYRGSKPVRVGNGARDQLQLDIYGEVIDAAAQYARAGGEFDRTTQSVLLGLGKFVAKNWNQPDEGIWEPRTGREDNTHSRLMCWTALDRLLEMQEKGILRGETTELFQREREKIRKQIHARAWNEHLQSYVSTLDGDSMDATLLRVPWYGFERPESERVQKTYEAVRETLGASDTLLYRYKRDPREGAFGVCGFWAAEYLAIGGGSLQEAKRYFEGLLGYANDLGLYSEEIDPVSGDALGNFPQAFTHIGLISAALSLQERERGEPHPAEERHQKQSSAEVSR